MPTEFDKWRDQKIIEIADEVAEIRERSMDIRQIVEETLVAPMRAAVRAAQVSVDTLDAACDRIAKLEAVLREIVDEYEDTYDASIEPGDTHWRAAANIPVEVMERAKALLK